MSAGAAGRGAGARGAWGVWASIGLTALIMACFAVLQTLVSAAAAGWVSAAQPGSNVSVVLTQLRWSGVFFSIVLWASCPAALLLILLAIRLRRGPRAREYLALGRAPAAREWLTWLGAIAAVIAASDLLTLALGREIVPEFMRHVYGSVADRPVYLPALWSAVVVAAPVFEEMLFRGFLFRGLESAPKVGGLGAVFLTSLFWTGIHQQYGLYELAQVFVIGSVIGLARWRTGSLRVPIAMHMLANTVATIEAAVLFRS